MPIETLAANGVPLALEALKSTIKLIADKAKPKVKDQILKWKTTLNAERLQSNIKQIGRITTIASREASTIDEIYYPSRVKIGKANSQTIAFASDLLTKKSRVTLIIGTAGQGKSVLLRYLCLRDLDLQGNIPLFIELRKIDSSKNLTTLLHEYLVSLGIGEDNPNEILELLLKSGKTRLFLDGYDEVSREYSLRTKDEIAKLNKDFLEVEVLITSRPGAISQHLTDSFEIHQCEIAPISPLEHGEFFKRIGVDTDTNKRLVGAISRSKAQIKALLCTPLMLTLLVKTCGTQQDLPDSLPEFYDSLFNILSSTHDGTKPGYLRQKATNLGNSDLEKLFCAFSFASKELFRKNSLSHRQFEDSLDNAIKISDVKCTLDGFKTDITETICLMVKDGLDTAYIHKSIQEYYVARFIHKLEDKAQSRKILESIENDNLIDWMGEIQFLEDFKDRTYENVIGIPHAVKLLEVTCLKNNKHRKISPRKLMQFLLESKVTIGRSKESKTIRTASWGNHTNMRNKNRYYSELISNIINEVMVNSYTSARPASITDSLELIQLSDLAKKTPSIFLTAINGAQKFCNKLEQRIKSMTDRQIRQNTGLLSLINKRDSQSRIT